MLEAWRLVLGACSFYFIFIFLAKLVVPVSQKATNLTPDPSEDVHITFQVFHIRQYYFSQTYSSLLSNGSGLKFGQVQLSGSNIFQLPRTNPKPLTTTLDPRYLGADQLITSVPTKDLGSSLAKQSLARSTYCMIT